MGRDRIHRESDAEMALAATMAQQWSQNLALAGHTIVHVESSDEDWHFTGDRRLDNGNIISCVGRFQIIAEKGKPGIGHSTKVGDPEVDRYGSRDEDEQLVIEDAEWSEIT